MGQIFIPGDAVPGDVAVPKKFSAGTNYQTAGTLPDRRGNPAAGQYITAVSARADSGGNIVMEPPLGVYGPGKNTGGFGTLIANDPNFVPANWPSNKTMFGTPGTMPTYPLGTNITNAWADGQGNMSFGFPVGAYLQGGGFGNPGTTELHNFDPSHKASNILKGVTLLGITGNGSTAAFASGYSDPVGTTNVVNGLSFTPTLIVVEVVMGAWDNTIRAVWNGRTQWPTANTFSSWMDGTRHITVSWSVYAGGFSVVASGNGNSFYWFAWG